MVRRCLLLLLLSVFAIALKGCQSGDRLTVVGFNVESGDANPRFIAKNYIEPTRNIDIWGFSEVREVAWGRVFETAIESNSNADFKTIVGTTGGEDKLAIAYNTRELELIQQFELDRINVGGNVRAPLVAQFRYRPTGREFLFVVNHLYRSKANARHQQASLLNQWAQQQSLPIIAVGDYNFDWNLDDSKRDRGYDNLTQNDVFTWLAPTKLVATHCHDRYNSVLDFVFVSGDAKTWKGQSEILFSSDNYCPDTPQKSDHRPVRATFEMTE